MSTPGGNTGGGYNGPWARAQLLNLPQYTASTSFVGMGAWRLARGASWALVGPPNSPIEPVLCIAVGKVSSDKAYLAPNGNFNPSYGNPASSVQNAKLQFSIDCPYGDPDFEADFLTAYRNLEEVQGKIAATNDKRYFLQGTGSTKSMRFNFPLWEQMNPTNRSLFRSDFTANYPIGVRYSEWWNALKATHQLCLMLVFDENDDIVADPELFESKLIGSLVEVTFSLKQYHMAANSNRADAYDTFTAKVESVSILSPAPVIKESPYKQTIYTRKPRPMPQTPTRSEQIAAAKAFGPKKPNLDPIPAPEFVQGSSGSRRQEGKDSVDDEEQKEVPKPEIDEAKPKRSRDNDGNDDDDDSNLAASPSKRTRNSRH